VSIKGSSYARFRRALDGGRLRPVLVEARELSQIDLDDALAMLVLIAAQDPPRYARAAARWAGRLAIEHPDVTIEELGVVVAALERLPERPELRRVLRALVER
jgi:hypothetical protein